MVTSMRPGSVIVDLAVERGGNCELAKPGEVADVNGVKIVGHLNVPGRIPASASSLYAKNLYNFLETLIDKKEKTLAVKWDDEIVKATMLTREGAVVHPSFAPKECSLEPMMKLIRSIFSVRPRESGDPGLLVQTHPSAALGPRFRGDERWGCGADIVR